MHFPLDDQPGRGHYRTSLSSALSWLASDSSRRLCSQGVSVAPIKHLLSPCTVHGDYVSTTKFSFHSRAQAYKVCTAIANIATF